ncbi:voltage-gated potassium channel, partial [Meira miltonrushii]
PSQALRNKYRRTPVFSGTIAPFAIMLEIPGFTSKWYVHITPSGQPDVYRANPVLLDVGLAFSLTSAVIANLAILARFSERMRPRKATAIAVAGFFIHDVINLVALIIFGVIHAVDDGFTYSEAYWMTTASTVASICCTISLVVDYLRTEDFKDAGSGLTKKQSQLVIVIVAFLAYISLSALVFALVMQLPFLDAMYFSVESIATIGLGDIVPKNTASRILLFFIAPGGIILLGVMVAIARQTILEEFEDAYKRRRHQYKQKLSERQKERKQHRQDRANVRSNLSRQMKKAKEGEGKEDNDDDDATDESIQQDPTESSASNGDLSLYPTTSMANSISATTTLHQYEEDLITQRKEIEDRFEIHRKKLAKAQRNEFWLKLSISASLFACFWLVGAAIFSAIEPWSYFDGFYFVFVVFTSIGYGDFHPTTSSGRAFFIVWALFGVGTLTVLFSVVTDAWSNVIQQRKYRLGRKAHKHGKIRKKMNGAFERILPAGMREKR